MNKFITYSIIAMLLLSNNNFYAAVLNSQQAEEDARQEYVIEHYLFYYDKTQPGLDKIVADIESDSGIFRSYSQAYDALVKYIMVDYYRECCKRRFFRNQLTEESIYKVNEILSKRKAELELMQQKAQQKVAN